MTFKLADKLKALDLLAKHLGMYQENNRIDADILDTLRVLLGHFKEGAGGLDLCHFSELNGTDQRYLQVLLRLPNAMVGPAEH